MRISFSHSRLLPIISLIVIILASLLQAIPAYPALAQDAPPVQEILGSINPGEIDVYMLAGLKSGQTVYFNMQTTSGNLDPSLGIISGDSDLVKLRADYTAELQQIAKTAAEPLAELSALRDRYFLAWDDDSGPGYAAALAFQVPQDGDYILIASGSLSAAGRITSGDYRLVIGVDAPEVLTGDAVTNGATIAVPDDALAGLQPRVQEATGSLDSNSPTTTIKLFDLNPGDTLSVTVSATSGNLHPILVLRDYGGKPVSLGNLQGTADNASLKYTFPEGGISYDLDITAAKQDGVVTSGDYRLLAGVNAPQVTEGDAQPNSQNVLRTPIEVKAGFKLQEIIAIDQQNEIMDTVGTVKLEWTDPALAFSPDECNCRVKEYNETNFNKFLESAESWPDFTFFNQQANRWTQNRLVEIQPDGHATYLERFTTNFQLNFDFQQYPFDYENFYIYLDMLNPESQYYMVPMDGFSEIDPENGEDEFILTDFDTSVESVISSRSFPTSRFIFHFGAPRHLEYYIFRVFIPVLLIIGISYITFFLKDFTRRIEVATGNVLLFIAFSWSLAEDYPRMGYLTFLDAIMAITFIINTLVVMYNVYLKWLETNDQRERAERIDRVADWVYPISYVVCFGITYILFFVI
jgi:Neurotransmitter-gated ion-channel ligand binding domain